MQAHRFVPGGRHVKWLQALAGGYIVGWMGFGTVRDYGMVAALAAGCTRLPEGFGMAIALAPG